VVNSVSSWLTISPPTIVTPSGCRSSAAYAIAQHQWQRTQQRGQGGHQDGPKAQQAGLEDRIARAQALFALGVQRKVDHHDRVLLDDADQQDDADHRNDAQLLRAATRASSAPRPADGSVDRMVTGWM
jgi:hypothetical protein